MSLLNSTGFNVQNNNNFTAAEYMQKILHNILRTLIQQNEIDQKVAELIYQNGANENEDLPALVKDFNKHYNQFSSNPEQIAQKICLGYIKVALKNIRQRQGSMNNNISIGSNSFNDQSDYGGYYDDPDEFIVRQPSSNENNNKTESQPTNKEFHEETETKQKSLPMKLSEQDYEIREKYLAHPPESLGINVGYDSDINLPGTLTCVKHRSMLDNVMRDSYSYINLKLDETLYSTEDILELINNRIKPIRTNYYAVIDYDYTTIIDEKHHACLDSMNDILANWKNKTNFKDVIESITEKSFRFVKSIEKHLIERINTYLKRYFILDNKSLVVELEELSECKILVDNIMKSNSSIATLGYGTVTKLANDIFIMVFDEVFRQSKILDPTDPTERNIILHNPHFDITGSGFNRKLAFESLENEEDSQKAMDALKQQSILVYPKQMVLTNINNRIFISHITNNKKNAVNVIKENDNPLTSLIQFHLAELLPDNKNIPKTFDFYIVHNEKDRYMKLDIGYTKISDIAIIP